RPATRGGHRTQRADPGEARAGAKTPFLHNQVGAPKAGRGQTSFGAAGTCPAHSCSRSRVTENTITATRAGFVRFRSVIGTAPGAQGRRPNRAPSLSACEEDQSAELVAPGGGRRAGSSGGTRHHRRDGTFRQADRFAAPRRAAAASRERPPEKAR